MYDRILIAVDGSDEARHAARRGLELARAFDAAVDALHVVEQRALRLTRSGPENERLRERGQAALAAVEDLASELDATVTTHLTEGSPAARISEFAADRQTDLVVVGRQGLTGLGKRLLGGVTENVLHRSDVPVFVVPGSQDTTPEGADYSRVLIPTDGSENAERAAPHGIAVAERYDAAVHVLNVVDLQAAGGPFDAGGLDAEFIERLEAEGRESVDGVVDEIEAAAPDLTVTTAVERTASFDGAGAGIGEYVEEHGIDLVVMGSHGRSNLERQLLGSVTSTVLRMVDVPVLVVERAD